ncbi:MAG TPA: hypothetical protein VGL22_13330 [Terracidiphilus sp.]|jgi:hypothetical protein
MRDIKGRLKKLEETLHIESVTLCCEGGETITIRQRDVLPLVLAGFRKRYAEIVGIPARGSKYDRELALLERVATVPVNDPMLSLVSSVLNRPKGGGK